MYALGDSGADDRVAELDPTCQVTRWIPVGTPTYDVEDLDSTPDGILWLADIGDNNKVRPSVALIGFDPTGAEAATPRVLTYPDGAHDAETLLISNDGLPVIVTKDYLGSSDVYTPVGNQSVHDLSTTVPTQLNRSGTCNSPRPPLRAARLTEREQWPSLAARSATTAPSSLCAPTPTSTCIQHRTAT